MPRKVARIIVEFKDGDSKILKDEELQRWLAQLRATRGLLKSAQESFAALSRMITEYYQARG